MIDFDSLRGGEFDCSVCMSCGQARFFLFVCIPAMLIGITLIVLSYIFPSSLEGWGRGWPSAIIYLLIFITLLWIFLSRCPRCHTQCAVCAVQMFLRTLALPLVVAYSVLSGKGLKKKGNNHSLRVRQAAPHVLSTALRLRNGKVSVATVCADNPADPEFAQEIINYLVSQSVLEIDLDHDGSGLVYKILGDLGGARY